MSARWPAGLHRGAASTGARPGRNRRIDVTPQEDYSRAVRVPLQGAFGQSPVPASRTVTVPVGPSGVGTRWWPSHAYVSTTTGITDNATVTLYFGTVSQFTQIGDTSYRGGSDAIPLGHTIMDPGDLILAVWSQAQAGDIATITLAGEQEVLT